VKTRARKGRRSLLRMMVIYGSVVMVVVMMMMVVVNKVRKEVSVGKKTKKERTI
jgi:hypothetical protein